jgi:undecaprenyl diphosphate synthase
VCKQAPTLVHSLFFIYLSNKIKSVIDQTLIEKIKSRSKIPRHVAIIMDGNGRWAKHHNLPRIEGHKQGIESVRCALETAGQLGVEVLTLYTFSTENWNRPKNEVSALMKLLLRTVKKETDELMQKNVRLMVIGDLNALPVAPRLGLSATISLLSKNTGLVLNLALSYSGRQEITQAVRKIAEKIKKGELSLREIDEALISDHMQTRLIGDPDLLIRTSGEMRISNFLLWQIAYTELYVTRTLWPDFREDHFLQAVEAYQNRERRYGKTGEQMLQENDDQT